MILPSLLLAFPAWSADVTTPAPAPTPPPPIVVQLMVDPSGQVTQQAPGTMQSGGFVLELRILPMTSTSPAQVLVSPAPAAIPEELVETPIDEIPPGVGVQVPETDGGFATSPVGLPPPEMMRALVVDLRRETWEIQGSVEDLYRRSCESGYGLACDPVWHREGGSDLGQAAEVFVPACKQGDSLACVVTGWTLLDRDPVQAAARFLDACTGGEIRGCTELGLLQEKGAIPVDGPDPTLKAIQTFEMACAGGEARACHNLSNIFYLNEKAEQDIPRAARTASAACDAGYLPGCANLAFLVYRGEGVPRDPALARDLCQRSCDGGYAPGCTALERIQAEMAALPPAPASVASREAPASEGKSANAISKDKVLYLDGGASPTASSTDFLEGSCKGGDAIACREAADAWQAGRGVDRNPVRAADLYDQACDGNDLKGCSRLGRLLATGEGGIQDPRQAEGLFHRACEGGEMSGCTGLGWLYEKGLSAPQDPARAQHLYQYACRRGDAEACASLSTVETE